MCVKLCVDGIDLLQIDYVNALMLYLVASAGKQSIKPSAVTIGCPY